LGSNRELIEAGQFQGSSTAEATKARERAILLDHAKDTGTLLDSEDFIRRNLLHRLEALNRLQGDS
jgi:hypothetical protein